MKSLHEKHKEVNADENKELTREWKYLSELTQKDLESDHWKIWYGVYGVYDIKEMNGNTLTIEDDAGDDQDIEFEPDESVFRYVVEETNGGE